MADGFIIHVDEDRATKLKAAADMADMSPEEYLLLLLDRAFDKALQATADSEIRRQL
jgi:hypothetical protein